MAFTLPTPDDIATLLRGRLRGSGGVVPETWSDDTNPTVDQVQATIDLLAPLVLARMGDLDSLTCDSTDVVHGAVRALIAERVALRLEEGYWPEEAAAIGRDLDAEWRRHLEVETPAIVDAVAECKGGEVEPGGGEGEGGVAMAPVWGGETQVQKLSW